MIDIEESQLYLLICREKKLDYWSILIILMTTSENKYSVDRRLIRIRLWKETEK